MNSFQSRFVDALKWEMTFLALWLVVLVFNFTVGRFPYLHKAMESNSMTGALEIIDIILKESELQKCSIVLIIDRTNPLMPVSKLLESGSVEGGLAVFETGQYDPDFSDSLQQISVMQKSHGCLTVVLVNDQEKYLVSAAKELLYNWVVVWPTKLLVVTHLPVDELPELGLLMSDANGLIVNLDEESKKSHIYLSLPYSHRIVEIASWSQQKGLSYTSDIPLFPNKFLRLRDGGHMKVVGEDFPPHMKVVEFPQGTGGPPHSFIGPLANFLDILSPSINFTYTLVRPPDKSWGYQQPNGTWIGMVGMVFRKEVDFALGPFVLLYTRAQAVDYALPLVGDYVRIAGKRGETEVDPWGFLMPLTPTVWATTLALMVLLMNLTFLFYSVDRDLKRLDSPLFNFIRILFQQDLKKSSVVVLWERILVGGWMVTALVLIKSYSGNLMSLLAVRYVPQPYQSLRSVLDDPKVTMLWEGGSAYVQVFMNAESGIYREVAVSYNDGRITYVKSSEYDKALEKLSSSDDHVLIIEDLGLQMILAEHFTRTGICMFYLSRELFLPSMFGLVVQKHSPLGPVITKRMESITESGLYTQWMKDAVPNSTVCLHAPTKIAARSSLALNNLWGVFVILVGGYILSLITLAAETTIANIILYMY